MDTPSFIVVALALFGFGLVSKRLAATPFTPPMAFMLLGLVAGPFLLGAISLPIGHGPVHVLAELTLILVLFGDAARIDLGSLRKELGIPVRLLAIGLPLTIALGTLVAKWFLPELSWLECAVLGAVLAPTDAALGQAVVSNEAVPVRIRQALNVESGLNDGIALPAVLALAALASMHAEVERAPAEWAQFAALQVTLGPLVGIVVAVIGARALRWSGDREMMAPEFERLAGIALALPAFAVAEQIGGNGFISAFVAGLVLGQLTKGRCEWLYDFLEAEGQLLMLLVFLAFGATLVGPSVSAVTARGALYAVLSLTLIRMIPVAISLIGSGLRLPTVLFLGWFGPRGLASILFALLVVDETMLTHGDTVFHIVMTTVLLSVLLHGFTAAPFASAYGRLAQSTETCPEEHRSAHAHPLRFNP